ncbi:hypothetical protein Tco_0391577, partial [Tanacetum coccineum]
MADATDSPTSLANRAIALVKMAKQKCLDQQQQLNAWISNSNSISHLSKGYARENFFNEGYEAGG